MKTIISVFFSFRVQSYGLGSELVGEVPREIDKLNEYLLRERRWRKSRTKSVSLMIRIPYKLIGEVCKNRFYFRRANDRSRCRDTAFEGAAIHC